VKAAALVGQWSFDRSCGLYDLVFTATNVSFFDYANPSNVISYDGVWEIGADNRVTLTLRRLDGRGAPNGEALLYYLDVTGPAPDLVGNFGQAGAAARAINAKRCANAGDRQ